MTIIEKYNCEACGVTVVYPSTLLYDNQLHELHLCETCADNNFVIDCYINLNGEIIYSSQVNIKNDSYIRDFIKKRFCNKQGEIEIVPIEINHYNEKEIKYYTSEGRNQFLI